MPTDELSHIGLTDILPHRGTMLLIDDIVEVDKESALVSSRIGKNSPLSGKSGVQPLLMVELAAQAAGVCNGLDRIRSKGLDSDQSGWLVGVKRAQFYVELLPFGSVIVTRSENRHSFGNLREVFCSLSMDEKLIGEVTLQLFQVEDEDI